MPRGYRRKSAPVVPQKECPKCHKMVDARGFNNHLRHAHSMNVSKEKPIDMHSYRIGYRDGFKDRGEG